MKKCIAFLLAAMLLCAVCVTAFAAPADLTGHQYKAYQIFSGTQAQGTAELTDIEWADGIRSAAFLSALKASDAFGSPNPFAACETAEDVAAVLEPWVDDSAYARAFAALAYRCITGSGIPVESGITTLDAGYYLVVDVTPEGEDIYNLALLQMVKKGTFEIATKVGVPEVKKEVADQTALKCTDTSPSHVHTRDCYNWAKADRAALGDTVEFLISSAVPDCAAEYDYYYFIVGDRLTDGLTLNRNSIRVTIGGSPATAEDDYTVRYNTNGKTFELALIDAKSHAGEAVEVTYNAVLNEAAIIGVAGNPNLVDVTYSNKPNEIYDGTPDHDYPGFPDKTKKVPTGETPKSITLTFTSEVKLYKVDQDLKPLTGAEFTLSGEALNIVLVSKEVYTAAADGTYWKLRDGSYTTMAPTTEDYMKPAAAGAGAGYVIAENGYQGDTIIVGGIAYRPYVPATDAGKTVYILVENNIDAYESTTQTYKKSTQLVEKTEAGTAKKVVASVDENGVVIFTGLNAGHYTIRESITPKGYNPIEDIVFDLTCTLPDSVVTGEETCTWSVSSDAEIAYNEAENAFELTVVNQKGSILPETGGIGTTVFYVLGAILAVGAVVLLIVKRRMTTEAE